MYLDGARCTSLSNHCSYDTSSSSPLTLD